MTRPKKQYFFRKNSDFLFCAPKKGHKKAPAASKERTAPGRKQGKLQLCFGEALELRSAVGAADSLDSDLALAVGAFLGGGLLRLFHGLLVQHIDGLDGHEQHEGHDEEVDDGVEKSTDADANIANLDDDIREIGVEEQADDGEMMSFTRELTIAVKAEPTTTPTAMSSTLPRMAKALNSSKKFLMPLVFFSDMISTAPFAADGMIYLYNTRRRQYFQVRPDALRSTGSSAGRWP